MATYPPPNSDFAIFDRDAFTNEIPNNIESLSNYFLRYPLAQGGETLVNTNVTGDLTVNSPNSVVIDSVGTVALGGTTATNISIGNSTSNTTLYGQTTYIDVTNLNVKDPNILVNKNGISPLNAGLQVESGGSIVSSLLNDTAGNWIVNSTNNKIYVDNISEKTIGNDVNFNSGVSMNGQTLDMTNGEIHNCPLIYSQNNSNLTIDAKGTGNILLQTNDITRVLINNSSMAVTGSLSTTSDILAQGLNSLRYNMSNGRLGIGNTSPQYTLDVSGTSRVTGQALFTSSTNSTSSTTGAVVVTGGLGIGGNTVSGGTLALGSILPTENVKLMISSTTVDSSCNGTTSGTSINMMSMNNGARNFTFGCDGSNNGEFYLGTSGGATNDPDYFTYWDTTGRFMVYPTASGPITAPISTDIFTARGSARIDNNLYVGGNETIQGVTPTLTIKSSGTGTVQQKLIFDSHQNNRGGGQYYIQPDTNVKQFFGRAYRGGSVLNGIYYNTTTTGENIDEVNTATVTKFSVLDTGDVYSKGIITVGTTGVGTNALNSLQTNINSPIIFLLGNNSSTDGLIRLTKSGGINFFQSGLQAVSESSAPLRFGPYASGNIWMGLDPNLMDVRIPIKTTSTVVSTNPTTGSLITGGGIGCSGSVNTIVGVGMGNDNSTVGGVISTTDNFVSGVFTAIDYSVGSGFLPRNNIPRKIIFNMSKQLTQGVATNILTLTHTASATSDDTFSISFNGFIQATTTGDNSSRAVNFLAVGVRANATAGVFVPNLTIGNSVDAHTTFASLMIGASTYSWPTLGPTTTTLALSQAMIIGTASQSLFITGEWTITQSTQTGGTFITGIA